MPSFPSALNLFGYQGYPMSQLFTSDDQNTGVSALASVLPMSIQGWFPFRLTGLISLLSRRLSGVFSSTTVWRHQFYIASVYFTETRRIASIIPTPPLAWGLRKNTSSSLGADTAAARTWGSGVAHGTEGYGNLLHGPSSLWFLIASFFPSSLKHSLQTTPPCL